MDRGWSSTIAVCLVRWKLYDLAGLEIFDWTHDCTLFCKNGHRTM